MLAYVFGRRKDEVFLKLKALLEPCGITRYSTDGWGAYERHLDPEPHSWQGSDTENREQTHPALDPDQALGAPYDLLFQERTDARPGHWAVH